jgi:general secretion pathway protein G
VNELEIDRTPVRGMTLIEIMVVLVIISLIGTAVAVNVINRQKEANITKTKADVQTIASQGVDAFHVMRGRYPSTEEGLSVLIKEGFLRANNDKGTFTDPWGHEYVYLYPGQKNPDSYDVKSYGPDGQPGTQDDIVSY